MSVRATVTRGCLYFCFVEPNGFSGQKAATQLVIDGLGERGWTCRKLVQPVLDRTEPRMTAVLLYGLRLVMAWGRVFRLLGARKSHLLLNIGQTRASFLRDAFPLILGLIFLGRSRIIVSLHGSLFMGWPPNSWDALVFRRLLMMAGATTVLGERQRLRLVGLGISADRIVVAVNSCSLVPLSDEGLGQKLDDGRAQPFVKILFLSSLIDTKGYPEYLRALVGLASLPGPAIEAVLCGQSVSSEFAHGSGDPVSAENLILEEIRQINRSDRVQIRWVRGAIGDEKTELFRSADIFVLPTRYAVEAQPIVLLEAMASGCAIVTTRVGEIPTILDDNSAVFLGEPTSEAIIEVLGRLVGDRTKVARLASAAHSRFARRYTVEKHLDLWESILDRSIGSLNKDP